MSETPPTWEELAEHMYKAGLKLGYQDALDDVQDRLKDMTQVYGMRLQGWQRHALDLLLDELRKP